MSDHIFDEVFEGLSAKVLASLKDSDYDSLEELHELSDKDLKKIKGIGKNSAPLIRGLLADRGFKKEAEIEGPDTATLLAQTQAVPDEEHVVEPGSGMKLPRRSGQVVMKINLFDPRDEHRRKNNDQKISVKIGDVVWGNKDKQWDLPRAYVDELITRGEAA